MSEIGRSGNVVAQQAEEIARAATALYGAATKKDWEAVAGLMGYIHAHNAQLQRALNELDAMVSVSARTPELPRVKMVFP